MRGKGLATLVDGDQSTAAGSQSKPCPWVVSWSNQKGHEALSGSFVGGALAVFRRLATGPKVLHLGTHECPHTLSPTSDYCISFFWPLHTHPVPVFPPKSKRACALTPERRRTGGPSKENTPQKADTNQIGSSRVGHGRPKKRQGMGM